MTLLSKMTWAMQKENKRCLPNEGRPHAQGVCQKKRRGRENMHTQRRYATCLQRHVKYNNDSPQLEMTKEKKACKKEFIHESPKIVHTLAHLDQVV